MCSMLQELTHLIHCKIFNIDCVSKQDQNIFTLKNFGNAIVIKSEMNLRTWADGKQAFKYC